MGVQVHRAGIQPEERNPEVIAKNATIYRVTGLTQELLDNACSGRMFHPLDATTFATSGFIAPRKSAPDLMLHSAGGIHGFAFRTDTKILPPAVINAAAAERAKQIEEEEGRKVGRKEMREIKEAMYLKLVQVAFTKTSITRGWFDSTADLLVIDTPSIARAEDVLGAIIKGADGEGIRYERFALGTSPSAHFSAWVTQEAPADFSLDDRAKFKGAESEVINVKHSNLGRDDILKVAANRLCVELAMTWGDKISFVLNDDLTMKGIGLIGIDKEIPNQGDLIQDELETAELTVTAGLIRQASAAILEAMGE